MLTTNPEWRWALVPVFLAAQILFIHAAACCKLPPAADGTVNQINRSDSLSDRLRLKFRWLTIKAVHYDTSATSPLAALIPGSIPFLIAH
jgi:hypothetical protein